MKKKQPKYPAQLMPKEIGSTKWMIDEIRRITCQCAAPEKDLLEALCSDADGWKMRLEEIKEDH